VDSDSEFDGSVGDNEGILNYRRMRLINSGSDSTKLSTELTLRGVVFCQDWRYGGQQRQKRIIRR